MRTFSGNLVLTFRHLDSIQSVSNGLYVKKIWCAAHPPPLILSNWHCLYIMQAYRHTVNETSIQLINWSLTMVFKCLFQVSKWNFKIYLTVVVVTAGEFDILKDRWIKRGMTCTSFTNVSYQPPIVSICINNPRYRNILVKMKKNLKLWLNLLFFYLSWMNNRNPRYRNNYINIKIKWHYRNR